MDGRSHAWINPETDARIAAHVHRWEQIGSARQFGTSSRRPFVALSREYGAGAYLVAQRVAELLNERFHPVVPWLPYGRDLLEKVAADLHLQRSIIESVTERRRTEVAEWFDSILNRHVDEALVFRRLAQVVRSLALTGHVVLVGRGSHLLTQDLTTGIHVRLVAPRDWRVHHVALERGLTKSDAWKVVEESEAERTRFLQTFFVQDPLQVPRFDLTIDVSRFNTDQVAEIIICTLSLRFGDTLLDETESRVEAKPRVSVPTAL